MRDYIFLSRSPHRVSPFSRGVIFTRARVSLALLSLRKNGDYSQSIETASKSPFLCVNISPIRYWFRAGAKAIRTQCEHSLRHNGQAIMIIFRKTRETGSSCPLDKELNSFLFSLVLSWHCRACFEDWHVYRSVKCLAQNGRPSESKFNYAVQPWTISLPCLAAFFFAAC